MPPTDESPNVLLLIGDCLREASSSPRTMPFTYDFVDFKVDSCYAPGTWTLPSHASLYSGRSIVNHGVSRRGQILSEEQAVLPHAASEHGYVTAVFSENPTFSTKTAFDQGIHFMDDSIHRKLFPSNFAADHHVDSVDLSSGFKLLSKIKDRPQRIRNIANVLYGAVAEFQNTSDDGYPHHGNRVVSHISQFIQQNATQPMLCFANLLDPHNPHHAPPKEGKTALNYDIPKSEQQALKAVNDDRLYLLEHGDLPDETRTYFDSWKGVFDRRHDVYETQIRYFDTLVERLVDQLDSKTVAESLIIIVGDHGQLFGEDDMLGHQTSLHPHGIEVPLLIKTPASWQTRDNIPTGPVSLVGLSNAVEGVVTGRLDNTENFVTELVDASRVDGQVIVGADGPTWSVPELRRLYSSEEIDRFCVRKLGLIEEETMTVFESKWGSSEIHRQDYQLQNGERELVESTMNVSTDDIKSSHVKWLSEGESAEITAETSARLEQLGYL